MSNVVRTSSVTWIDRLRASIKGFLVGIVLVVVCLIGLFWNEGRAVLSFCFTLVLGALTIAVAWFFYRPFVAVTIIAAGLVTATAIVLNAKRRAVGIEAGAATPT